MLFNAVTDQLHVFGQPELPLPADLASRGYTTFINNRPDAEDAHQPGSAAEAQAAAHAGLDYIHLPVTFRTLTEEQVRVFCEVVRNSRGLVYAHCRSGVRSLALWLIGEVLVGRMTPADVMAVGRRLDCDMTGAVGWLEKHGFAETPTRPEAAR